MQAMATTLPKSWSRPAEKASSTGMARSRARAWQSAALASASSQTWRRRGASGPAALAWAPRPKASASRATSRAPMRATAARTELTGVLRK